MQWSKTRVNEDLRKEVFDFVVGHEEVQDPIEQEEADEHRFHFKQNFQLILITGKCRIHIRLVNELNGG